MAYDGTLRFDTSLDPSEFQKGAGRLGDIIGGLGIFKIIEKGFQAIAASVDLAVKRYDTLNNFPRVLQLMGYGAEEASAATQKLADGVLGLPTRLDEVVSTAQRLTVLTGNLEKATATTLALNNAFLASGTTSADVSRGMEQYLSMMSSGEVTLQRWRTLQETMGYALQRTAEAFGFAGESAQNDLYRALKEGEITFDQFNSKIIELNAGVGGFEEMARNATGGIGTAFTNMRTRIAAGVTDIIAAIDKGFSQTRFKSIENIINTTSTTIRKVLKDVAGAFEFVAKHTETLIKVLAALAPAIISVAAAFGLYKAFLFVTNFFEGLALIKAGYIALLGAETAATAGSTAALWAYNLAQNAKMIALLPLNAAIVIFNLLTGASVPLLGGATAATWSLNAAMLANPVMILVLGIGLLIGGIIALCMWLAKGSKGYQEHKKDVDALADSQKATAEAMNGTEDAFKTNTASIEANAQVTKGLISNLRDVASSAGDAETKHARMESTVASLNAAVDGLNIAYDRENGVIMDLNSMQEISIDQLEALTDAKAKLAEANAWQDRANELVHEHVKLLEEQTLVQKKIDEINNDDNLTQREKRKLLKDLEKTYNEYGTMIEEVQDRITIANDMVANSNAEAADSIVSDYERQAKAQRDAYEAMNGARDAEGRNIRQLANLYNTTTDQILADMAEQGLTMEEWSERKAQGFTKEGQSLQGVANQWGMTTDEVIGYMDEWGMTLDEFVDEMEAAHTKEGLSLEDLAAKWGTTSDLILTEMDNMGISMQDWSDAQDYAWAEYQKSVGEHTQGVINSFKEIPEEYEMSADEMINVLKTNRERYAEWRAAMTEISGQVSAETLAELEKLGPGALSAINEMRENGGEGLREFDELIRSTVSDASEYAVSEWGSPDFTGAPSEGFSEAAQQVNQNTELQTAVQNQMEDARATAETVDFTSVGQSIATDILTGLNGADFSAITNNIANAIRNGTGSVTSAVTSMNTSVQNAITNMSTQAQNKVTQMMTQINSTITTRTATIRSSVTNMSNAVTTTLNTMSTQAQNITTQMMTQMNSIIVSRTPTIRSSVTSLANGVVQELDSMSTRAQNTTTTMMTQMNSIIVSRTPTLKSSATSAGNEVVAGFEPMVQGAINVTNKMMDGIGTAMDNKAPGLFQKAKQIADQIAKTIADALEVKSPSRVMIRMFENVMMGIYKGMDGMSGLLYKTADDIADNISDRLNVSPDVFGDMFDKLRSVTFTNPFSTSMPTPAMAGAPGSIIHETNLYQDIKSPKPLSPSEMTREGQDFLRRSKWKLQ
jgi:tape measure domain-containing protein